MFKKNKKRGFTLVEIMIVTFLMLVTLGIISSLFVQSIKSYTRGKNIALVKDKINTVLSVISDDLRSCTKIITPGKNPGDPLHFDGEGSRAITFVKFDPVLQRNETITYDLVPSQDIEKYGYNFTRNDSGGSSIVETGIKDLRFKYSAGTESLIGTEANFAGSIIDYNVWILNIYGLGEELCRGGARVSLGTNSGITVYSTTIKSSECDHYMRRLNF